jgi:alpha-ketoglutarate-dependent taurine dioxygenase
VKSLEQIGVRPGQPRGLHRAAAGAAGELVRTRYFASGPLPLVVEPNVDGLDLSFWARANLGLIEQQLLKHGAILFRGFDVCTQAAFEEFLGSVDAQLMDYVEGATPRTSLGGNVYTSTEFPAGQSIALHNELSYVVTFPTRLWFLCAQPATTGGETPIADVRRVFELVPPAVRRRFAERGWMLVRNFGNGLGPSWQSSYHVGDRAAAEELFRRTKIGFEWTGEDSLRTRQVRPAASTHPATGESVWFNHVAFWHVSSLEPDVRAAMLRVFKEEDLPYNTYYGDGSPIEVSVIDELREAYRQATVAFAWQKGDVLMIENMLAAHGRRPFTGPRKVLAAMGRPFTRKDL